MKTEDIIIRSKFKKLIHLICENCFLFTKKFKIKLYVKLVLLGILTFDMNCISVKASTLDQQLENFALESDEVLDSISSEDVEQILVAIQSDMSFGDQSNLFLSAITPSENVSNSSSNSLEQNTITEENYIFEVNFLIASAKLENLEEFEAFLQRHMFTEEKLREILVEYYHNSDFQVLENGLAKIKTIVD